MKTLAILALVSSAAILAQQTAPPPPPPTDIAGFDDGAEPDEPGRPVARLSVASGDVSVKRGDAGWVAAALNAPLMEGDSLSTTAQAAGEVQFDFAHFVRLAGNTELRLARISADGDPNAAHRIEIGRGIVTWRVLRDTGIVADIATPYAGIHPLGQAAVRVEVAPDGGTRIIVRHGEVEVQTARGTERVREGGSMYVHPIAGTNDVDTQLSAAQPVDRWDTWSDQRDAYLLRAVSPQYVSQDVYGSEDLDAYGQWSNDPQYGNVWMPSVAADWAPYRDGRWVWEDYYGWTWIDNQPWGWAPFHYGSWYQRPGYGWAWYPGQRSMRTWWRPAMVGFFGFGSGGGGFSFGFGFSNVGWVPLAPYERYRPWYSRRGFGGGRTTIVNNINVTNVYRNARIGNGATIIGARDFERGNYRNRSAANFDQLRQASLVRGAGMTPTNDHLRFSDRQGGFSGPRSDLGNRRFYGGNNTPSPGRTPFNQQQESVRSRFNTGNGANNSGGIGSFGNSGVRGNGPSNAQTRPQGEAQGWRSFGSPRQDSGTGAQGTPNAGSFFRGGQFDGLRNAPTPGNQGNVPSSGFREGSGGGGGGSAPPPSRQPESPGGRRFGANSGSFDMSQPVVRQRDNSQDQGRRFGGFGGSTPPIQRQERQSAPQQQFRQERPQQDRPQQQFSRPSGGENRGGGNPGGGGGGAPRGGGPGGNRRGR